MCVKDQWVEKKGAEDKGSSSSTDEHRTRMLPPCIKKSKQTGKHTKAHQLLCIPLIIKLKVGKHGATKEEIAPAEKEQTENLCWKLPARELGIPVHVLVQRCHTDHAAPPSPQATAFPMKQKDKEGGGKRKRKEGRKEGRKEKGEEEGRKEGRKSTARNQHKRSKEE